MFDDIFGGMFDFNGDGHTGFLEEATGFTIINELTKEEKIDGFTTDFDDDCDLDL